MKLANKFKSGIFSTNEFLIAFLSHCFSIIPYFSLSFHFASKLEFSTYSSERPVGCIVEVEPVSRTAVVAGKDDD